MCVCVCVTVENFPTVPGTLGIYQPLDWARLIGYMQAGVTNNREVPLLPFITFIEIITHHSNITASW